MNDLLDAAIAYAAMGWHIFPCKHGQKVPATLHGVKDSTTDPDKIRAWWTRWPEANIGLACGEASGVYVADIDVDKEKDVNGFASLADLGPIQRTVKQNTPRGGAHYFFRTAVPPKNKNSFRPGIDIRGNGYYVVLAPSANGVGCYRWENPPTTTPLAEWPEILRPAPEAPTMAWDKPRAAPTRTVGASDVRSRASAYLAAMEPSMDGRNGGTALLKAASALVVGFGLSQAEALDLLWSEYNPRCSPAYDQYNPRHRKEYERKVTEALKSSGKPMGYLLDDGFDMPAAHIEIGRRAQIALLESVKPKKTEAPKAQPTDYRIPEHLLQVPGFIGKVVDYCLATAPYPNRTLAFAGALALQAFLCSRKVRTAGNIRPNIYLLALAPSGSGKDWPRKLNKEILCRAGLASSVGDRFASAEGIEDEIFRSPALLMQTDEIDGLIQSMGKKGEPLYENMQSALLSMFGAADTTHVKRKKAGDVSGGAVANPHLILFGTAIPVHFYGALNERMLTNGLFARLLILDAVANRQGQNATILDPPDDITGIAKWWAAFKPGGDLAITNPDPITVPSDQGAVQRFAELRKSCDNQWNRAEAEDEMTRTVYARVAEQAQKLALIYACSVDPGNPVITAEAAGWAADLATWQANRMLAMAHKWACQSEDEKACMKIVELIRRSPDPILHNKLADASKMSSKVFAGHIATLLERQTILPIHVPTKGRPGKAYVVAGAE